MSLGRAWVHEIRPKIAAAAPFSGIEAFYEDIEFMAKALPGGLTDANLVEAASEFKRLCDDQQLDVIALQPFLHYEGLLDRDEHRKRLEKLRLWFSLAEGLGTDLIQIPSNFLSKGVTADNVVLVADLQEVASLGLAQDPPIRFAYENICWGTFVRTWKEAWQLVEAVDRPNFGLCLDSFHIAGSEWADPGASTGMIEKADEVLRRSLTEMIYTINPEKIFYVQVIDAEMMQPPLKTGHPLWTDTQNPLMTWSRNARLFPFEKGGYMPVIDILRAFTTPPPHGLGYRGWISLEFFSQTTATTGTNVPIDHAKRGIESWNRLSTAMGWD